MQRNSTVGDATDLVRVNAINLSELLHHPLGSPGEGGGAAKPLHLSNEKLMRSGIGN